jgi:hypothetical protein
VDIASPPRPPTLGGLLPTLIVSAVMPFVTYRVLTAYAPSTSEVLRLLVAGIFPTAHSIFGLVRRRSLDIVGIIVIVGIAVSIAATFLSGNPKLLLIRESFVTGALGLLALSSLFWNRPLMFYIGRQMSAGQDPTLVARFDALWQRPRGRQIFRVITVVWGIGWLAEFGLRIAMVETLTIATVLAASPFVFTTINLGLFAWMFAYVRRARRKAMEASALAERGDVRDAGGDSEHKVGLCVGCLHAKQVHSSRGSVFYLCGLSAVDSAFPKYPRLPVIRCLGYREKP